MHDEEIWLTRLFNDHLAGVGTSILGLFNLHAENADRPWANFITMQILVALVIIVFFTILKSRLSVDKPGIPQQLTEELHGFLKEQSIDNIGEHGPHYLVMFGT